MDPDFLKSDNFKEKLKEAQSKDVVVHNAKSCVTNGNPTQQGRLQRVQRQLRIENDILTKSGRRSHSTIIEESDSFGIPQYRPPWGRQNLFFIVGTLLLA